MHQPLPPPFPTKYPPAAAQRSPLVAVLLVAWAAGFVLLMLLCLAVGVGGRSGHWETTSAPPPVTSTPPARLWYEGGTLHNSSGLAWQNASRANKLATCADFVRVLREQGQLNQAIEDQIAAANDIRPCAEELVRFLDAAFERDPDPAVNRACFGNLSVSEAVAMGVVMMRWGVDNSDANRFFE